VGCPSNVPVEKTFGRNALPVLRYSGTVRVRLTQPRRSSQARRGQGLAKEEAALAEAKAALAKEEAALAEAKAALAKEEAALAEAKAALAKEEAALAEAKAALAKVEAALAKEEAAAHGDGHGSRNLGQEWPVQPRFS
jgi:chromosome segregation ATPase